MIGKIERLLFFLIIFFLPSQFGKHFWPQFSFINGIRVDYLSPTIFLTDILIFFLFLISVYNSSLRKKIFELKLDNKKYFLNLLLALVFLNIIVLTFSAKSPFAHLYGIIKFSELLFFARYIASTFSMKRLYPFINTLAIASAVSSILAIMQFFKQSSIGGFWYFLGERTFTASTIGIATMNINGTLLLRPYSFFPHPNVLAFFLFFSSLFIILKIYYQKEKYKKALLIIAFLLAFIALLLTFSRIIIFLSLIFYIFLLLKFVGRQRRRIILISSLVLFILSYFAIFSQRFFGQANLEKALFPRLELINISFAIIKENSYFGIGLNNFFIHASSYQKEITSTLLQPVHNIFILVLVELGIFSFIFLLFFIKKSLYQSYKKFRLTKGIAHNFYMITFIILVAAIAIGVFDHFLLTVQQGRLLIALIIGLVWSQLHLKRLGENT